jgi:hypothetical protein
VLAEVAAPIIDVVAPNTVKEGGKSGLFMPYNADPSKARFSLPMFAFTELAGPLPAPKLRPSPPFHCTEMKSGKHAAKPTRRLQKAAWSGMGTPRQANSSIRLFDIRLSKLVKFAEWDDKRAV